MNKFAGVLAGLGVSALLAFPAVAQDKAKEAAAAKKGEVVLKTILDNDQVRVVHATFRPGDVGANTERPLRVIHVIKGGTLTLHYPDGKKEKLVWKTGDTTVRQATPQYYPKNEGKSDIVLLVTNVKVPKK